MNLKPIGKFAALCLLTVYILSPSSTRSQSQSPSSLTKFDGEWSVRLDCPSNTESSGAKGYIFDFTAHVKSGVIKAQHGEEGKPASLTLDGTILDTGDAIIYAHGYTGSPEFTIKRPPKGSGYSYKIKAHFNETSGIGTRVEGRACTITFTKQ